MSKYQAECHCSIKHMYRRTKLQFNNEMHNCLHFYNSGKEMASVFHLHFRNSPDHVPIMGCYAEVTIVLSNH